MRSRSTVAMVLACVAGLVVGASPVPVPAAHATRACRQGTLALSFDDGPEWATTPGFLSYLAKENLPATFFMIGSKVDAHPALARRVARAGFQVGDHTYRHEDLTTLSLDDARKSIVRTWRALRHAGVTRHSHLFRFPYGRDDADLDHLLVDHGWTKTGWKLGPHDGTGDPSADELFATMHRELQAQARKPGAVKATILMHDGAPHSDRTLTVLPDVVADAERMGFCFTAIGPNGLALSEPATLHP